MVRLLLLLASVCAAAEPPAWITDTGREQAFPVAVWQSGWSTETVSPERDQAKCLEIVTTAAQAELARSIRVRIEADTESRQTESGGGASSARFESSFADRSRSTSDITLVGRRLETWFDAKAGRAYAISAIERSAIAQQARERAASGLAAIQSTADAAQAAEAAHPADALGQWGRVLAAVQAVESDLSLAHLFGPATLASELTARCAAEHARTHQALARLAGRQVASIDDLAFVLAAQLGRAAGDAKPRVLVPACTVAASRLSSPLGRFLGQALGTQLQAAAGWNVVAPGGPGPAREVAVAAGAEAVALGATWERPDGIRVVVAVHRLADGRMLAMAEATLPAAALVAAGLSPAPQNVAAALADQQQFRRDEVVGGAMRLELWTSKGDDAPVFVAGELARIFVRSDRPAHLRVVDHLSDGRRVLLVDDLYLDESKVNLVYQLPGDFEVSAPFGAETIQANASTIAFPHLEARTEDGYQIITETLAIANAKTRGLKRTDPAIRPEQAESRVVITTMDAK